MKKIYFLAIGLLILLAAYLNLAYGRFYQQIGKEVAPPGEYPLMVVPSMLDQTTKPLVLVAMGDSLTAGVGASGINTTYPYLLSSHIAEQTHRNVKLTNLAVPGATVGDVLGVQMPKVSTLAPDIVTILIGVNDMHRRTPPAEYAEHIKTIVQASRATSAKVYVLRLPYIGDSRTAWFPYQWYFDYQTNRYNQVLDQALQNEDVTIIDLYTPTESVGKINSVYYSNDGFHPSDVGYSLWSSVMYDYFNF